MKYTNPSIMQHYPEGSPGFTQLRSPEAPNGIAKSYSHDEYDIIVTVVEKSAEEKEAIAKKKAKAQKKRDKIVARQEAFRSDYIAKYVAEHGHEPTGWIPSLDRYGNITGL